MNKHIVLFLLLLTTATLNAQILYRISGNGLCYPSFIVGTHHQIYEFFTKEIPGIQTAMEQTTQVYGEVRMSDMTNPDTLQFVQQALLLPDNKTIKDILSPEYYDKLNTFYEKTIGLADKSQRYLEAAAFADYMYRYNPTAHSQTIISYMGIKNDNGVYVINDNGIRRPAESLDTYFQNQAIKAGKPVHGLESVAFQANLLYSTPLKESIADLQCLLDNQKYYQQSLKTLTKAYKRQDPKAIEEAMNMKIGNKCDSTDTNEDALITQRNANWLRQMPKIMIGSPTLFVVGAGHLFGEKGILSLLRQAGYHVEPVME